MNPMNSSLNLTPSKGLLQLLILRVLFGLPLHGYALQEKIETLFPDIPPLPSGTIYTLLRRLDNRKLLASSWTKSETGKPKRVYHLTPQGIVALREGLEVVTQRYYLLEQLIEFKKTNI